MGLELHITRAEHWALNDDAPITIEEWLAYVKSDAELSESEDNPPYSNDGGPYFFNWSGVSSNEEPWVDWFSGNVSSKWPDSALYQKMLKIA